MAANKTTADAEETPAKGGKKKIIVLALVLLVVAAGLYFFMGPKGSSKPAPPTPGAIVTVDPFIVNLAGGGYLKIGFAVEFTADAASGTEKPDVTLAQDIVIDQFSQADPNAVNNARRQMKQSLIDRIKKAYEGKVITVNYTEYVTQ